MCAVQHGLMMLLPGNTLQKDDAKEKKAAEQAHQHSYDVFWGKTTIRAWSSPLRAIFWAHSSSPCHFQMFITLSWCLGTAGKKKNPTVQNIVQTKHRAELKLPRAACTCQFTRNFRTNWKFFLHKSQPPCSCHEPAVLHPQLISLFPLSILTK